ncbi:MAG: glycosyltransferase [Lachnospiraceae bacterium]|nr:glycosyltransferase [Lachnospiraceae bacterium]
MSAFSVCIIVKNEEKNILKCLQSLQSLPVEIILVDTGSTDSTVELAKKYTANIFSFPWSNDFSAARNFSISKASNDWILVLDADENITDCNCSFLLQFVADNDACPCVGRVQRINHIIGDQGSDTSQEWITRFFNKRYFHYSGSIHEQVTAIEPFSYTCMDLPIILNHSGYAASDDVIQKANRDLTLLLNESKYQNLDAYMNYQIGQCYYQLKKYNNACFYFEKCFDFDLNPELDYVRTMVLSYGYSLIALKKFNRACILSELAEFFPQFADYHFLLGFIYMNLGDFQNAIASYKYAIQCSEYSVSGVNSFKAYYNMGVIEECLGNHKNAIMDYRKCGEYPPAQIRLGELSK